MLKLHYDVQNLADWQYVNKADQIEFYAQVYILNRAKMAELLIEAYKEGMRDANELRIQY
jgi:predicted glycosyl hydrolase (DUF1957 family)